MVTDLALGYSPGNYCFIVNWLLVVTTEMDLQLSTKFVLDEIGMNFSLFFVCVMFWF